MCDGSYEDGNGGRQEVDDCTSNAKIVLVSMGSADKYSEPVAHLEKLSRTAGGCFCFVATANVVLLSAKMQPINMPQSFAPEMAWVHAASVKTWLQLVIACLHVHCGLFLLRACASRPESMIIL